MKLLLATFLYLSLASGITLEDLQQAQKSIDAFNYGYKTGRLQIIEESMQEVPTLQIIPFGVDANNKEACIVTYASLNIPYANFLDALIQSLASHFKGHLLYRKGGWPNPQRNCHQHAFSAYGFKVCAIDEAYRLGYKKVLWLDSIIEVLRDIEPLFAYLDTHPLLYRYSYYPFRNQISPTLIHEFHLKEQEICTYKHIATGILGFNFGYEACTKLLDTWHDYSTKPISWAPVFPEQLLFSCLVSRLQLDLGAFGDHLVYFGDLDTKSHFLRINYARTNQ